VHNERSPRQEFDVRAWSPALLERVSVGASVRQRRMLQLNERVNRMKKPKALGSSCRNCKVAANAIARAATDAGAEI
jgi:hypothetical protein